MCICGAKLAASRRGAPPLAIFEPLRRTLTMGALLGRLPLPDRPMLMAPATPQLAPEPSPHLPAPTPAPPLARLSFLAPELRWLCTGQTSAEYIRMRSGLRRAAAQLLGQVELADGMSPCLACLPSLHDLPTPSHPHPCTHRPLRCGRMQIGAAKNSYSDGSYDGDESAATTMKTTTTGGQLIDG